MNNFKDYHWRVEPNLSDGAVDAEVQLTAEVIEENCSAGHLINKYGSDILTGNGRLCLAAVLERDPDGAFITIAYVRDAELPVVCENGTIIPFQVFRDFASAQGYTLLEVSKEEMNSQIQTVATLRNARICALRGKDTDYFLELLGLDWHDHGPGVCSHWLGELDDSFAQLLELVYEDEKIGNSAGVAGLKSLAGAEVNSIGVLSGMLSTISSALYNVTDSEEEAEEIIHYAQRHALEQRRRWESAKETIAMMKGANWNFPGGSHTH